MLGILGELGGKDLASRRKEQRLTMLHKILHGELAIPHDAVVRLELSHSFIDSFDNHSTASGPDSCIRRRPPGNAVSGHSSTMRLLVWWLSPQGQAGDAITPHR